MSSIAVGASVFAFFLDPLNFDLKRDSLPVFGLKAFLPLLEIGNKEPSASNFFSSFNVFI